MRLVPLVAPQIPQDIKDLQIKRWMEDMSRYIDDLNTKAASIYFNRSEIISVTTATANTDFTVTHHLNRTPEGYFLVKTDKATEIYTGATAWTSSAIYLKSSVATCAIKLLVF